MEDYKNKLGNLVDKLKKEQPKTPIQEVLPVKATPVERSFALCAPNASNSRASKSASPRGELARNCLVSVFKPGIHVREGGSRSRQIEPGRLQLGVLLERVQRLVAADS